MEKFNGRRILLYRTWNSDTHFIHGGIKMVTTRAPRGCKECLWRCLLIFVGVDHGRLLLVRGRATVIVIWRNGEDIGGDELGDNIRRERVIVSIVSGRCLAASTADDGGRGGRRGGGGRGDEREVAKEHEESWR